MSKERYDLRVEPDAWLADIFLPFVERLLTHTYLPRRILGEKSKLTATSPELCAKRIALQRLHFGLGGAHFRAYPR